MVKCVVHERVTVAFWLTSTMSVVYTMYKKGERQVPCGIPSSISLALERLFSFLTLKHLFLKKESIILVNCTGVLSTWSLWRRPSCQTRSKAFATSKNTAAVFSLLLALVQRWSTLTSRNDVEWFALKLFMPNYKVNWRWGGIFGLLVQIVLTPKTARWSAYSWPVGYDPYRLSW